MRRLPLAALTVVLLLACRAMAVLSLPFVFSDNVVLQRDMPVPIWGVVDARAKVTVDFAGQSESTTAGEDGKWTIKLQPLAASSDGRDLKISAGSDSLTLHNVLVGEVWICSGQSNMEKPLGEQRGQQPTEHYKEETAAADYPSLRLLQIPKVTDPSKIHSTWLVCTPKAIDESKFSAVGYFFGRKIHKELNVPVGMIHSSWGGTRIEPWTTPDALRQFPELHAYADAATATPPEKIEGIVPSSLYRGMIEPLVPFAIRGALWYQGESNLIVNDIGDYPIKMHALVSGWRKVWNEGDFPFYYVQIAPHYYTKRTGVSLLPESEALFWEAQAKALDIPHSAMVVTTDLVDNLKDIHPIRKREVGERLAACALAKDYGRKDLEFTGPTLKNATFRDHHAVLTFDHAAGLKTSDGKAPTWFNVAGDDNQFVPADAIIENDTVIVSSAKVADPKSVRFAWREDAMPNLQNGAGLPAVPFRTDKLAPPEPPATRPR